MKNLKQMLDAVLHRSALNEQASYFNSNSSTLPAMANEVLAELKRMDWPELRKTGTISMTTANLYDMPSDMVYLVSDSMQADGQIRQIKMPASTSDWWEYKARDIDGFDYKMRFVGGQLEIQNPDDGQDLIFEYITDHAATSSTGTTQSEFQTDQDFCVLDDELMIKAIKWRYNMTRGVDGWERDKMLYNEYLRTLRGQSHGATTLSFGESRYVDPLPQVNIFS